MAAGFALALPRLALGGEQSAAGPNAEVRMAIIGLGGINTVGGVGGRGRQLIDALRKVAGVKVVAVCDVDKAILDHGVQLLKDRGQQVSAHADLRKVLDDKTIDAVAVALPNHWHALATVWACQAGKDVYVEKPFSYSIWEGTQMVAAARKYGRMVQVGTQRRSSTTLRKALEYLRSGAIGPIRYAHAIIYRPRQGIGKAGKEMPVPATVDYDLWCGPASKTPLVRKQLHYDWHWVWPTGNGEIGNNGPHMIDVCRWALGQDRPPPRAMSIGGRFRFDDDGETPNTQVALFDYQPAPLICEIRNVSTSKNADSAGKFRGGHRGVVIDCEGGYLAGDAAGVTVFDGRGKKIKEIRDGQSASAMETAHMASFVNAVRSRKTTDLNAEATVGHFSAACSHMANISHRLGKRSPPEAIRSNREMSDAFERCQEHLRANSVDLGLDQAVLGPWVTLDHVQGRFVGEFADRANELSRRNYRKPFVVPEIG
jgi:predicted dehydrogenase